MRIIILSDIHANLSALEAVMKHADDQYGKCPVVSLGDVIDYGMRPNETLDYLRSLGSRLLVNLAGNHEQAVLGIGLEKFSSERGRLANKYTVGVLEAQHVDYINNSMTSGFRVIKILDKELLFVHGDLSDPFWGSMTSKEMAHAKYNPYDFVFSGHTHNPGVTHCYYDSLGNGSKRGRGKTTFVNPGSVGQPRNHNPRAQYVFVDLESGSIHFNSVDYDILKEQSLFHGEVDDFYRDRLSLGI